MNWRIHSFLAILLLSGLSACWAEGSYQTPEQTFDTYLQACKEGDYAAAEACFTRSSRELLAKQLEAGSERDPEALKEVYEELKTLGFTEEKVNAKRAILWPDDEKVPPLFLRIQVPEEGWRLDYHFMSNYIRVDKDGWGWRNQKVYELWKTRE